MPIQLLPEPAESTERVCPPGPSLDRRAFLAGVAAGGVALGLGNRVGAADKDEAGVWYALVSDTHIAADPSARARGQVMADNLRAVVADILAADSAPRGVLIDGDLALKDGQAGDYRTFLGLLEPLRKARLSLHLGLGNHDDRGNVREVLRGVVPAETRVVDKQVAVIDGPGPRFVVLDSLNKVNSTPGLLGQSQLAWLGQQLDAQPDAATLVVVHHNPAPQGASGLIDTKELLDLLRPRRQVKGIIFGHTHVWSVEQSDGLYLVNLPAVAYPFAQTQPLGWCRFRPEPTGGELELRCVGGNRKADRQRVRLTWRSA
jgi:3',5'-cyclic AMP phosphodiesterase CpdA